MKLPNPCLSIVVNFNNGGQETIFPKSKIEEFEDCYEVNEEVGEGEGKQIKLHVLMKSAIRNIIFISK